jgi:hypothetical protein
MTANEFGSEQEGAYVFDLYPTSLSIKYASTAY